MAPLHNTPAAPTCESESTSSLIAPRFFRFVVAAFGFVCASFAVSLIASSATAAPASALLRGIDVSSWQHSGTSGSTCGRPIDWVQVRNSGISFAYVKSTEATSYTNPCFAQDWAGIASVGLLRGSYHYAKPALPISTAVDQARYFVSRAGSMTGPGDLPGMLDLEETGGLDGTQLSNWARAFMNEVTLLTGKKPVLYMGAFFFPGTIAPDISATYQLWLPSYMCQNNGGERICDPYTDTRQPRLPAGWSSWTWWQFSSIEKVPGIYANSFNGQQSNAFNYALDNVDMNWFCCDLSSLQALAGAGSGGGSPFGSFDGTALNSANTIHVAGWAIDPDTTAPIQVHFYTDGAWTGATTADGIRTDVGAVYPGFGSAHGFSADFAVPTGAQNMCAFGINVASGLNLPLGCLSLGGAPKGSLDLATVTQPGKVRVAGWASDPNDWSRSTVVHVYAGTAWTSLPANQPSIDVNNFFGITGNHRFNAEVDASGGPIQVCVYGINDTGPGGPSLLSCKSVTAPTGSPYGSLDVVKARPGAIDIAGWVIDPDTANPTQVHVYVDGVGVAIVASGLRPDVAAAFPLHGANHGFSTSIPVSAGSHRVCVYSINMVGTGSNQTMGCRTVVTRDGNPFGSIDWAASGYGHIGVAGWALDPNTDDPIVIHIYVNGVGVGRLASDYRADVAAAFGNGPNHGFTYLAPRASAAPQTICVFGLNVGAGTNSLIGCRVV